MDAKFAIVDAYLTKAPPGELKEVYNDIRTIYADDGALHKQIQKSFKQYNENQFIHVTMPGEQHQVLISKYAQIDEETYLDTRSKKAFKFDHLKQEASDATTHECSIDQELFTMIDEYVQNHFSTGVMAVYPDKTIVIVGNKYNPANYWNGRWRSSYTVSSSGEVEGNISVEIHYYEDGNVQLHCDKTITGKVEGTKESVLAFIKSKESEFENGINESFSTLSETNFKALRRVLPVTRNKIDWQKITNYRIGSELGPK